MTNWTKFDPLALVTAIVLLCAIPRCTVAADQPAGSTTGEFWWRSLLANESVRKEIGLSDQSYSELRELDSLSPQQAVAKFDVILDKSSRSRLTQIRYQVLGPHAVLLDDVAEKLQIDPHQRQRLLQAERANRIDHADLLDSLMKVRFASKEKMDAFVLEHIKRTDDRVSEELTQEQREKLVEIQGEPLMAARRLRISLAASHE